MNTPDSSPSPAREFPVDLVLPAICSTVRWAILRELAKGASLPTVEIARRLRSTPSAISKHFKVLYQHHIVVSEYGRYKIAPGLLSADRQSLDFGCLLIRLDRLPK